MNLGDADYVQTGTVWESSWPTDARRYRDAGAHHRPERNRPTYEQEKIRVLADKLVEKACAGDVAAANGVMDRVEGKPVQVNENFNHTEVSRLSDDELARLLSERLLSIGNDATTDDPEKLH